MRLPLWGGGVGIKGNQRKNQTNPGKGNQRESRQKHTKNTLGSSNACCFVHAQVCWVPNTMIEPTSMQIEFAEGCPLVSRKSGPKASLFICVRLVPFSPTKGFQLRKTSKDPNPIGVPLGASITSSGQSKRGAPTKNPRESFSELPFTVKDGKSKAKQALESESLLLHWIFTTQYNSPPAFTPHMPKPQNPKTPNRPKRRPNRRPNRHPNRPSLKRVKGAPSQELVVLPGGGLQLHPGDPGPQVRGARRFFRFGRCESSGSLGVEVFWVLVGLWSSI